MNFHDEITLGQKLFLIASMSTLIFACSNLSTKKVSKEEAARLERQYLHHTGMLNGRY